MGPLPLGFAERCFGLAALVAERGVGAEGFAEALTRQVVFAQLEVRLAFIYGGLGDLRLGIRRALVLEGFIELRERFLLVAGGDEGDAHSIVDRRHVLRIARLVHRAQRDLIVVLGAVVILLVVFDVAQRRGRGPLARGVLHRSINVQRLRELGEGVLVVALRHIGGAEVHKGPRFARLVVDRGIGGERVVEVAKRRIVILLGHVRPPQVVLHLRDAELIVLRAVYAERLVEVAGRGVVVALGVMHPAHVGHRLGDAEFVLERAVGGQSLGEGAVGPVEVTLRRIHPAHGVQRQRDVRAVLGAAEGIERALVIAEGFAVLAAVELDVAHLHLRECFARFVALAAEVLDRLLEECERAVLLAQHLKHDAEVALDAGDLDHHILVLVDGERALERFARVLELPLAPLDRPDLPGDLGEAGVVLEPFDDIQRLFVVLQRFRVFAGGLVDAGDGDRGVGYFPFVPQRLADTQRLVVRLERGPVVGLHLVGVADVVGRVGLAGLVIDLTVLLDGVVKINRGLPVILHRQRIHKAHRVEYFRGPLPIGEAPRNDQRLLVVAERIGGVALRAERVRGVLQAARDAVLLAELGIELARFLELRLRARVVLLLQVDAADEHLALGLALALAESGVDGQAFAEIIQRAVDLALVEDDLAGLEVHPALHLLVRGAGVLGGGLVVGLQRRVVLAAREVNRTDGGLRPRLPRDVARLLVEAVRLLVVSQRLVVYLFRLVGGAEILVDERQARGVLQRREVVQGLLVIADGLVEFALDLVHRAEDVVGAGDAFHVADGVEELERLLEHGHGARELAPLEELHPLLEGLERAVANFRLGLAVGRPGGPGRGERDAQREYRYFPRYLHSSPLR